METTTETIKLYKRNGRRFIRIENHEGMYYQNDGTFQKERDENSVGFCTESTVEEDLIFTLKEINKVFYQEASEWQRELDILPTSIQLINAIQKYRKQLDIKYGYKYYWVKAIDGYVSTGFGSVARRSDYSDSSSGGVGYLYVDDYPDNRNYGCSSRSIRKVIHVKK